MEALAAVDLMRQHFPEIKIRFINVIDLMVLQPKSEHPHGLSDQEFDEFDEIFTMINPLFLLFMVTLG